MSLEAHKKANHRIIFFAGKVAPACKLSLMLIHALKQSSQDYIAKLICLPSCMYVLG